MKITPFKTYKNTILSIAMASSLAFPAVAVTKTINNNLSPLTADTVKLTTNINIPPEGTTDTIVLKNAPKPDVNIMGETKNAVFVVDVSKNVLYRYDEKGEAICAYSIASGKTSTPTQKGVRVVSHVETYPYKYAPASSKRRKSPKDYGPKIIILNKLDPLTGEKASTGQFIHGNRNYSTLGKYVSHGCMRMDNEVIKELAAVVKRGDIVLIK